MTNRVREIAKLITDDPDIFNEAGKKKRFVGLSTSTVTKVVATKRAEVFSGPVVTGKGLCVYLVGDARTGLDRHVKDKQRLGFSIDRHVVVDFEPGTAEALADYALEKYPGLTVICGDMRKICQRLGYENIEHLDFDAIQSFDIDHVEITQDAVASNVANVHLVGGARGPRTKNVTQYTKVPIAQDGPRWLPWINQHLDEADPNQSYVRDTWFYKSGGVSVEGENLRLVTLAVRRENGTFKYHEGWVDSQDYGQLVSEFSKRLNEARLMHYPRQTNPWESHEIAKMSAIDPETGQVLGSTDWAEVDLERVRSVLEHGSPMFFSVLNSKKPHDYTGVAVNVQNFISVPGYDNFYVLETNNLNELELKLDQPTPEPEVEPELKSEPEPVVEPEPVESPEEKRAREMELDWQQAKQEKEAKKKSTLKKGVVGLDAFRRLYQSESLLFNDRLNLLLEINFKDDELGIDPHDLKQPLPELSDKDWEVVIEMLKAGELRPAEAFNLGLSKREIESVLGYPIQDSDLLEEDLERLISPEDDDLLDVSTAFETIKNVSWDSGYTPRQVYEHLAEGELMNNNYDVRSVKYHMQQLRAGNIQSIEVDDEGITDGYHRITAAKVLGIKGLPYHWPTE